MATTGLSPLIRPRSNPAVTSASAGFSNRVVGRWGILRVPIDYDLRLLYELKNTRVFHRVGVGAGVQAFNGFFSPYLDLGLRFDIATGVGTTLLGAPGPHVAASWFIGRPSDGVRSIAVPHAGAQSIQV